VKVSALLISSAPNDAALEQIIGRMSLEPLVTAVDRRVAQAAVHDG